MLSNEEVSRFISRPRTPVESFERFTTWTRRERTAGNYVCFAVIPHGMDSAIGIIRVRQLEPGFATAEWASPSAPASEARACSSTERR